MYRVLFFLFFIPSLIFPQIFGKNKVRYKNFEWTVIETEHFEIYFSSKIENLANLSAFYAENAYKRLSSSLKMDVSNKIPLVLFASHYDFQQTNIILELIDKGVGGFAEVFKKRIAIPFTGSYKELERVINHELTHIFCYELLYGNLFESIITNQILPKPPMWFMEGLASYYEGELSPEGEMVLKDAVLQPNLIPLSELSDFRERPYLAYQQSHSLMDYISKRYGEEVFSIMLRKFAANIQTEKNINTCLGISQEKLEDEWIKSLKEKYWPLVKERKRPQDYGKRIFLSGSNPRFSPSGEVIALFSKEDEAIVLIKAEDGKVIKRIKKRGSEIKDIPPSWSADGCNIAFVGREEKNDVIFVYSIIKGKFIKKIALKILDEAKSISFSSLSDKMVVSGIKDGEPRQFILLLSPNELLPITFKMDSQPFWQDNNKILFLREEYGSQSIYLFDIKNEREERLLSLPYITYISGIDKERFILIDGLLDVYLCSSSQRIFTPILKLTTGALSASYNPSKNRLVFSSYSEGREDVYIMDINEDSLVFQPFPEFSPIVKKEEYVKKTKKGYEKRFTLDYRAGDLLYDTRQGLVANIQMAGSDILGNNRFVLRAYNPNLLDFSNISMGYLYLAKRPSMAISIFKEQRPYFFKNEKFVDSEYGLMGGIEYPFSQTRRIEMDGIFETWDRNYIIPSDKERERNAVYLLRPSIVEDTSEWGWIGPLSGRRIRLVYEKAVNPSSSKNILEFDNIRCDIRTYIRLTKMGVLAGRVFYEESNGRDKREFPLGGVSIIPIRWNAILRGYDYDEFWGNKILSTNLELRIPFIERLDFALGLSIRGIRAVIFYDWATPQENLVLSSSGIGFRMTLGFLPMRLDYGWPKGGNKAKTHFSLGYDF